MHAEECMMSKTMFISSWHHQWAPAHNALYFQVGLASGRSLGGGWRRHPGCPRARWTDQLSNGTGSVPANLWRQAGHCAGPWWSDVTARAGYAMTTTKTTTSMHNGDDNSNYYDDGCIYVDILPQQMPADWFRPSSVVSWLGQLSAPQQATATTSATSQQQSVRNKQEKCSNVINSRKFWEFEMLLGVLLHFRTQHPAKAHF